MLTDEELDAIERWQHSDGGKAELAIHGLIFAADDLTDAIKTREGLQSARANIKNIMDAKHKLDDLIQDLGLFAIAAE